MALLRSLLVRWGRCVCRLHKFDQDTAGIIRIKIGDSARFHIEDSVFGDMTKANTFCVHESNSTVNIGNCKGNMVDARPGIAKKIPEML